MMTDSKILYRSGADVTAAYLKMMDAVINKVNLYPELYYAIVFDDISEQKVKDLCPAIEIVRKNDAYSLGYYFVRKDGRNN